MIISLTLPENINLKIRKGDYINFNDSLYELKQEKKIEINIADRLRIKPENIFYYLVKVIGDNVKKKEVLAGKKGWFYTHKIYSDYDGTLIEIDHQTGKIFMSIDNNDRNIIHSSFKGIIKDIEKRQLRILIENGDLIKLKDINKDGAGKVYYFQEESFFNITEDEIRNKIIFIENLKSHLEAKCEALGCIGFVMLAGKLSDNLPSAKIEIINDFLQAMKSKKKYIIFSKTDKKAVLYD